MIATRRKIFGRRSRAGCRTCRLRHMKCDETPVACKNCTSAGWKCDGYDESRLGHPGRGKRNTNITDEPSLSLRIVEAPLPGSNSEERRGFALFQRWTVPTMSSFFDTRLWNHLVLPMSHAERAVTHAVVALSAIHEDVEARGAPLSREDLNNPRQRFALEQYTRAISSLNSRRHSKDPKLREVILTCCLLFVVFELTRGQYDAAFAHLQQGLSVVKEMRAIGEPCPSASSTRLLGSTDNLEISLTEAMSRLQLQSTFFGIDLTGSKLLVPGPIVKVDAEFETIADARAHLDVIFQEMSPFFLLAFKPYADNVSADHSKFDGLQKSLRKRLKQYLERLDRSETKLLRSKSRKDQRAIDLIRLHHNTFALLLETYVEKGEAISDMFLADFQGLVTLSERIVDSFSDESHATNSSRPTLLLDMGILPALLYVCLKCPDIALRQQALESLQAWPHREGPWDSNLLAVMASQVLEVEREAEFQRLSATAAISSSEDITYISPVSRLDNAGLELADDQLSAVLKYRTKELGREGPEKEKWIILDQD